MKNLDDCTVDELIERLRGLGVEWTGATTRKGPLLSAILQVEADRADPMYLRKRLKELYN